MARNINKVVLLGHLGDDPLLRATQSGTSVLEIPLFTNYTYKNKAGDPVTESEVHYCTFWAKDAENVSQFCRKGSLLYVEGRLKTDKFTDSDNNDRERKKVVVSTWVTCDSLKKENRQQQHNSPAERPIQQQQSIAQHQPPQQNHSTEQQDNFNFDEDIPF